MKKKESERPNNGSFKETCRILGRLDKKEEVMMILEEQCRRI